MAQSPVEMFSPAAMQRIAAVVRRVEGMANLNPEDFATMNAADTPFRILVDGYQLSGGYYKGYIITRNSPQDIWEVGEEVRLVAKQTQTTTALDGTFYYSGNLQAEQVYESRFAGVTSDDYLLFETPNEEHHALLIKRANTGRGLDLVEVTPTYFNWDIDNTGDPAEDILFPDYGFWQVDVTLTGRIIFETLYGGPYRAVIVATPVIRDGLSTLEQYSSVIICECIGRSESLQTGRLRFVVGIRQITDEQIGILLTLQRDPLSAALLSAGIIAETTVPFNFDAGTYYPQPNQVVATRIASGRYIAEKYGDGTYYK